MQIQMADIRSKIAGTAEAKLGIEICAVQIHLAAAGVDNLANLLDRFLENSVGRGIGDHQGGQFGFVCFRFGAQIGNVNIALLIAGNRHYAKTGHDCAGRIGSVS